ncbi:MAG: Vgb family protein, partial [Anaerolineales bacterium]
MVRIRFTFIVIAMLAGCTSTPAPTSPPIEIVTEKPTEEPTAALPETEPTSERSASAEEYQLQEYAVPPGTHPHDVAPAPDGSVWYTAQISGALGKLDPETGETHHIPLGSGSSPHGVIVGPDGAPWITDSGLNAIVRVDPATEEVQTFPLPAESGYTNLNTAAFDPNG